MTASRYVEQHIGVQDASACPGSPRIHLVIEYSHGCRKVAVSFPFDRKWWSSLAREMSGKVAASTEHGGVDDATTELDSPRKLTHCPARASGADHFCITSSDNTRQRRIHFPPEALGTPSVIFIAGIP